MARLSKLSLLLILNYTTQLITHSRATTPYRAHNATNADGDRKTVCRDTDLWIHPPWPLPSWGPPEVYLLCQILLNDLYYLQPEIHTAEPPLHEFLPRGSAPAYPGIGTQVRTPWRFIRGKQIYLEHGSFQLSSILPWSDMMPK